MNVSMRNIRFLYGKNTILENVSLEVKSGEIHALLGENGAGKSTLMNLLGGVLNLSEGEILLDDKPVRFQTPNDSIEAGVGFIHQELNLIGDLTVYENMFITDLPRKGIFLDRKRMINQTAELFEKLNISIDPCAIVRDLDVSYKQIVEICRALLQNAGVLIMDEPTTSLTETEISRVFEMMKKLKESGVAIIFISHKLNEVMEICDTYTVLRNGVVAAEGKICDTSVSELSAHLVGHSLSDRKNSVSYKTEKEILRLESLCDGKNFSDISLSVNAGEILGVTGLLGDGRSELFLSVFGAGEPALVCGKIYYDGREYKPRNTTFATEAGIAYLARNRAENGIIRTMSVLDNGTIVKMPHYKKGVFLDDKKRKSEFSEQRESLQIKMKDETDSITRLSGGNQQKVLIARWLMMKPKLLILDNPTQGVDIGAKEEIYDIIRKAAKDGAAVIILSPDAQEITTLCERAVVMFHGRKTAELSGDELNEFRIMYFATGGKAEQNDSVQAGDGQC